MEECNPIMYKSYRLQKSSNERHPKVINWADELTRITDLIMKPMKPILIYILLDTPRPDMSSRSPPEAHTIVSKSSSIVLGKVQEAQRRISRWSAQCSNPEKDKDFPYRQSSFPDQPLRPSCIWKNFLSQRNKLKASQLNLMPSEHKINFKLSKGWKWGSCIGKYINSHLRHELLINQVHHIFLKYLWQTQKRRNKRNRWRSKQWGSSAKGIGDKLFSVCSTRNSAVFLLLFDSLQLFNPYDSFPNCCHKMII